jgi:RNA polymerase sigma factor (sigma-70 family)
VPQRHIHGEPDQPAPGGHELAALIARGDRVALGQFYELWFDRIYRLARRLTGRDESFCLDIVQESMLRIVRSIRPMPSDDDLKRWMVRLVHTTALDLLRREARQRRRHQHATPNGTAHHADLAEQIAWLRARLAELPEEESLLLRGRFGLGRTLEAAGALAGLSGHAAHGRLRRITERLRRRARENFDEQ